jgi:hypothetical protein
MSSIQNITEQFKGLSVEELLTIIAAATAEAKKSAKVVSKAPKEAKEKKGSMPKGSVPPQLVKPRAWVNFTLQHGNNFGWESFEVKGQTEPMPSSVLVDGKNVFEATGKPLNNKQAMSLSKVRWDRKAGKGTREDLYKEFEAQPEWLAAAAAPKEAVEESAPASACSASDGENDLAPPEVKKSAVDKNREKKAAQEAAALKKAQDKEAETLRKKAEALRKKEEAAAAKAAAKPPAAPKAKKTAEKAEPKEVVAAFDHENDGFAHPWDFKGKKFLRDYEGNMWFRKDDPVTGEAASDGWAGKFDRATNSIDTEAEEPELEDEENEVEAE